MLLVSTAQSYPLVASRVSQADPRDPQDPGYLELADITGGDWPTLTDLYLRANADLILGTCAGITTAVYRVLGWDRREAEAGEKITFQIEPALDYIDLIGAPQPGGPWRRGESRGTRKYPTPRSTGRGTSMSWHAAVQRAAQAVLGEPSSGPRMTVRADGTVIVDVPSGTPVLVRPVTHGPTPSPETLGTPNLNEGAHHE